MFGATDWRGSGRIKVLWQPARNSCVRVKEFLKSQRIESGSIDVHSEADTPAQSLESVIKSCDRIGFWMFRKRAPHIAKRFAARGCHHTAST